LTTALHPPRREKSGRRQRESRTAERLNELNRREAEKEMSLVKNQPHRKGSDSPLRESALGRFVHDYGLARELYDAGLHFAQVRGLWLAAINAPRDERHGGSGGEIDKETEDRWRDSVADWRKEMARAGGNEGRVAVEWLACDGLDLPANADRLKAISALMALGKAQGRV
jgi:hypothetical protein